MLGTPFNIIHANTSQSRIIIFLTMLKKNLKLYKSVIYSRDCTGEPNQDTNERYVCMYVVQQNHKNNYEDEIVSLQSIKNRSLKV